MQMSRQVAIQLGETVATWQFITGAMAAGMAVAAPHQWMNRVNSFVIAEVRVIYELLKVLVPTSLCSGSDARARFWHQVQWTVGVAKRRTAEVAIAYRL